MGKGLIHRLDDKDKQRWALGLLTDLCQHDEQALGLGIRLYVCQWVRKGTITFLEVLIKHLYGTIAKSFTLGSGAHLFYERNSR